MKTFKVIIIGTVQGVFFRKFVKENADRFGVKGFVRNLEDGNLEIILEGRDKEVLELIEMCKKGPAHSNIKDVKIESMSHQGFDSFKVSNL